MSSGLFAGRYKVERVLGQGATATVHLARDTERGISVAIKILRPELAESRATDRFLKEIRRTAELQHPHILRVLDSGESDGQPYFVLPYMEGGTLRTKLQRESQLSFDETISILRTIAEALDYAHGKGLIHRDVKPENILFTSGQACLGDFGIARALETVYGSTDGSTSSNTVRGTYAYMSPEQAAGGMNLDGRSDIYALACVAYEMISGMQAFIGPTPEAVVAQRFAHTPREVRVYRPSAPPAVEVALSKAFAMSPADRYKTATEFVEALAEAVTSTTAPTMTRRETPAGLRWDPKQRRMIGIGAVLALIAAAAFLAVAVPKLRGPVDGSIAVDTTRLVVLPLERDDSTNVPQWRDDDLLQQGLARYRDVSLVDQFQVSDAMTRHGSLATSQDGAVVAASLGAGRYIRGRVTRSGNEWRVAASLYDAPSGKPLYQARESIVNDVARATVAYARLADTLLLRGATADSNSSSAAGSRSLSAVQAFGRAQVALGEWDLVRADSALQAAVSFDPNYARAHYLLAQVRAWRGQSPDAWGTVAERAVAISGQLNDREVRLARALVHLGRASYDSACALYGNLARRNDRDFAAWFGLGQCRMSNRTVVADATSPSGWRYQMSAHQAMRAYSKAFEILPSVYRGYESGAFQQLQRLLLITDMPIGYGPDSAVFYARPGWIADSLLLVPYPATVMWKSWPTPPGYEKAVAQRRAEFKRLALSWSSAYPQSAGAKEAVALSLERLGDPSAIDTIRRARSLSNDTTHRTQLAAAEVQLLVKFGVRNQPDMVRRAYVLGDSVLTTTTASSPERALALIPVAVLLGRCRQAEVLIGQGGMPGDAVFPASLYVEAHKLLVRSTMSCHGAAGSMSLRDLATAIDRTAAARGSRDRPLFDWQLLLRPAIQGTLYDFAILERLSKSTSFPQANAALFAARKDFAAARSLLAQAESEWVRPPTPDIALATANVWLTMADSVAAARVLDVMSDALSLYEPRVFFQDAGTTSAFIVGLARRADLANARNDDVARRASASVVAQLWANADEELRPVVNRMSRYASAR